MRAAAIARGGIPAPVVALALAGLAAAVYAGGYGYPLVFDDATLVVQAFQGFASPHWLQFGPRWLSSATFALTTEAAGLDVPLLRAQNVALHAATVAALFYLLRLLLRGAAPADADRSAAIGAVAFAAHPVAVYGVAYLAQRSIVMATLFSVLCLYAWLRGRFEASAPWMAASAMFYALALLAKEHAVMLPAVAVAASMARRELVRGSTGQMTAALAAMGLAAVVAIWLLRAVLGAAYEPGLESAAYSAAAPAAGDLLYLRSVATQAGLFFRYAATWLVPLPQWMAIDLRADLAQAWPLLILWPLAFGAVLLAGLYQLVAPRGRRALGLALVAPCLLYATEFAAVRAAEPFVLYRSYLWGIGFAVLVGGATWTLRPRTALVAGALLCAALATVARERLETFASPLALWEDAAAKLGAARPLMADRTLGNYGTALLEAGRTAEAIAQLDAAIAANPRNAAALSTRASARAALGDLRAAEADYDRAIAAHPKFAEALAARCGLRVVRGDLALARADCERAIALAPDTALAHLNLGVVHVHQRNLRAALAEFEAAARLQPGDAVARHNAAFARAALERVVKANYEGATGEVLGIYIHEYRADL